MQPIDEIRAAAKAVRDAVRASQWRDGYWASLDSAKGRLWALRAQHPKVYPCEAGFYEQCSDHRGQGCGCEDGWRSVRSSGYLSEGEAEGAARRLRRERPATVGGSKTWVTWWTDFDGVRHEVGT